MAELAQGQQEEQQYRQMGAGDDQIDEWKQDQVKQFRQAGANDQQINDYFGVKEPKTGNIDKYVQQNIADHKEAQKDEAGKLPPHEASTFVEYLQAAWQGSVFGTAASGGAPPDVVPGQQAEPRDAFDYAPYYYGLVGKFAQLGLDLPFMGAGAVAGGAAGAIGGAIAGTALGSLPGTAVGALAGGTVGAGFGAFAAPTAIRELLMEHYQDPNGFKDPKEFMAHLGAAAWKATKDGVPGAVAAATGGIATPVLGATAGLGAEFMAMMGSQAAIAGKLPTWNEFRDGAVMMGALHGTIQATKLMNIYAKTGERPADIAEAAHQDPVLMQKMMDQNPSEPEQAAPKEEPEPQKLPAETMAPEELKSARADAAEKIKNLGSTPEEAFTAKNGSKYTISMAPSASDSRESEPNYWSDGGVSVPNRSMRVEVKDADGKAVAFSEISNRRGWPDKFFAEETHVNEDHRRLGLANAMYDYAGKNGAEMRPGRLWGDGTRALWDKRDVSPGLWAKGTDDDIKGRVTQRVGQGDRSGMGEGGGGGEPPRPPSEPPDDEKQYQSDVEKVTSRLSKDPIPSPKTFVSMLKEKMDKFYEDQVNAVEPLKDARNVTGKEGGGLDDPFQQAVMAPGWRGKMQAAFEKDGGLDSVFEPVKKDMQEFLAYSMSKRALERDSAGPNGEGKETGIDLESAANVVKQVEGGAGFADKSGTFKEAQMRWVNFQNQMLNYAREHQVISKESQKNIMKDSGEYIPMTREQDLDQYLGKTPDAMGQIAANMKGSERKVNDPILQTYLNTARIFHAVAKNDVGLAMGDLIDNGENGRAVGQKVGKPTGADNEITFKRDGEDTTYALMPNYARAIKSLDYDAPMANSLVKIGTAIGSALRKGTTLVPDFIMRHFIRQTATGSVYSQANPLTFMYHTMLGTWDATVKNDNFYKFLDSGASGGEVGDLQKYFGDKGFWSTNQEAGNFVDKTWNALKTPFHALEWAAYRADVGQRIAEFKIRGGMDENATPEDIFKAGSAAREVTLDYDRHGAQTKVWRALTPFMNIGIQGTDRLMRGFADDPFFKALTGAATLGYKGDLSLENAKQIPFGLSAQAAMAITMPTVVNWAINHKDSRYQDAPQWEKDLYWLFPQDKWEKAQSPADAMSRPEDLRRQASDGSWEVNNGTTMKISKPFELGVLFGSLPERLLNKYFDANPHEVEDFAKTVIHGVVPNVIPTAVLPFMETATNYNLFRGRPIIPDHLQGVAPEMQYTPYTSGPARQIGKLLGYVPGIRGSRMASPMIIDNWIREWSGTGGQYALQIQGVVANRVLGNAEIGQRPAMGMADVPFVKAFISRNPDQGMQPIQDFYDLYNKAQTIQNTAQTMAKEGRQDEAAQYLQDNQGDSFKLQPIHQALGAQAALVKAVNVDPRYSATEKRQLIDTAYYQMWNMAKQGVKIINESKKAMTARSQ